MANIISTDVYGMIQGNPPFGQTTLAPSRVDDWAASVKMGFPVSKIVIHPVTSGFLVGGQYVYGIIEVLPDGNNVHGKKYATNTAAATLVTSANA